MLALLFLSIAAAVLLTAGLFLLVFVQVAFRDPPPQPQPAGTTHSDPQPSIVVPEAVAPESQRRHPFRFDILRRAMWFIQILLLVVGSWMFLPLAQT